MIAPVSFAGAASVAVIVRANIRQGTPSIRAPIRTRVNDRTDLSVIGLCNGDSVAGNDRWWMLPGDSFIWTGACSGVVHAPAPPTDPNASLPNAAGVSVPPAENSLGAAPLGAAPKPIQLRPGFSELVPDFAAKLTTLLDACSAAGYDFRLGQGLRPPLEQAKVWCQWRERTPAIVDARADALAADGAPWLAGLLRSQRDVPRGDWASSQLPGAGWHQWGEAADCYCWRDGHLVENGDDPAYRWYADKARALGLTPGFYFQTHKDPGHVQLRPAAGARDIYSWAQIEATMKARFGAAPKALPAPVLLVGYHATKAEVEGQGPPPDAFLNQLVDWGRTAPRDIFDAPDTGGIYPWAAKLLGPFDDLSSRRGAMLEVMRVLAGFESSWNWNAGVDTGKRVANTPENEEAGAWHVSADSMRLVPELRALVLAQAGSDDPDTFRQAIKANHPLAMEYIARLLRRTVNENGPILYHHIDSSLSRAAAAEFSVLLAAPAPTV